MGQNTYDKNPDNLTMCQIYDIIISPRQFFPT